MYIRSDRSNEQKKNVREMQLKKIYNSNKEISGETNVL